MARLSHTAGYRLHDSRVMILVSELLKRGARTKMVERLTGVGDLAIRDVYRELFKESPTRGPSGYSHGYYVSTPVIQFDSSVAASIIEWYLHLHTGVPGHTGPTPDKRQQAGEWLGDLYCKAYDNYTSVVRPISFLNGGLTFERFAFLGLTIAKRAVLQLRSCRRCSSVFVSGVNPEAASHDHCPACVINAKRSCYRCGTYVPLDHGDIPPRRAPMCIKCAVAQDRVSTLRAYERTTGAVLEVAT